MPTSKPKKAVKTKLTDATKRAAATPETPDPKLLAPPKPWLCPACSTQFKHPAGFTLPHVLTCYSCHHLYDVTQPDPAQPNRLGLRSIAYELP